MHAALGSAEYCLNAAHELYVAKRLYHVLVAQ